MIQIPKGLVRQKVDYVTQRDIIVSLAMIIIKDRLTTVVAFAISYGDTSIR